MITILLLLLPTLAHLVLDTIRKKYSKIIHWQSALLVIITAVLAGIIDAHFTQTYWWQTFWFACTVHLCFFDPIWNWSQGQRWNHHGTPSNPERAITDKLWDYVPAYAEPLLRLWILSVGYGVYFHLDLIIAN